MELAGALSKGCALTFILVCVLQAVSRLQDAAAAAESAAAVYNAARSQSGAALAQAHDDFNTADTAFNRAKTVSYKNLNTAQQTYKEALAA